ncbi:MAG: tRNA preQ1(34) S-adenosylmethionine ribosyltransferase-isomerase QueA [Pseudomonadota bacterium]
MRVDSFDFELPEDRIALRPASPRDAARMLVVKDGEFTDGNVRVLPELLRQGDLLVLNDTRVLPAALEGVRWRGETHARIYVNLHKRTDASAWRAFVRPAKRLKAGDVIDFGDGLEATIDSIAGGEAHLFFSISGTALDEAVNQRGAMPLPPYITAKRAVDERDRSDYQPVFAREEGSVASPTASLHFTPDLLNALSEAGVQTAFLTLHVGAGTFLPVKSDDTDDHTMHAEFGVVPEAAASAIAQCRARRGRVIAVGTTVLRLLESAADGEGGAVPWSGETDIFITPGFEFQVADILMTNFHLPRSTLFMLVSAFCGLETMKAAYAHAIQSGYRFYSYGDASLLFRHGADEAAP